MADEKLVEELAEHLAERAGRRSLFTDDLDAIERAYRDEYRRTAQVALEWLAERGRLVPDGAERVTEHAQLMSGGGMHVRYEHPEIERVFPLEQWIAAGQRGGGRVFRRTILALDDWTEIARATAPEETPYA